MRHWILSAAIGVAILSSSSGSASPVQGIVAGTYVLNEKLRDNALQAINSAVLSNANHPLARNRLRKSIAVDRIRVSKSENRFGIAYDAKTPIVVWIGEEPIKWKLAEGFVFDVSAKTNGDAVFLTFRGNDSERTTTYRNVGQDLVDDTIITSPLLSKPIVYRQVFSRTN